MILQIDRTKPFDAQRFGLSGPILEEDPESLKLTEIDISKIVQVHVSKNSKEIGKIENEEKIKRLKKMNYIRLDSKVFETLWDNRDLLPESLKTSGILFDGTIWTGGTYPWTICLLWKDGEWQFTRYHLMKQWHALMTSAVIKKKWYHFLLNKKG